MLATAPAFSQKNEVFFVDSVKYVAKFDTVSAESVLKDLRHQKQELQQKNDWIQKRLDGLRDELQANKDALKTINDQIDAIDAATPKTATKPISLDTDLPGKSIPIPPDKPVKKKKSKKAKKT
jgi:septal ring factor EnvC (AmiA/AmiB activator)